MSKLRNFHNKGFTIIEVLVAITIGSIAMIFITQLISTGFLYHLVGFSSFNAQADATALINRMAKEIRQGPGVVAATDQGITILEYLNVEDEAPYQVRFYLNGTDLIRGQIPPTGTGPSYTYDPDSETFRTLATDVKNGAGAIFEYYDQDGNLLSAPIVTGNITLVRMTLSLGDASLKTDFTATTEAQLRFKKTNL
ncbi:MAG TPA: prepilin-type N-terminal cleavage/methylation domain-containing protein [Candidatus Nanoarchaeia archaeon]|nr:hypothetical protein [uncultured archaeon]